MADIPPAAPPSIPDDDVTVAVIPNKYNDVASARAIGLLDLGQGYLLNDRNQGKIIYTAAPS